MARELYPEEVDVFVGLIRQIRGARRRNRLRKNLYDANFRLDKIGFSIPPHMVDFQTPIGWAEKVVSVPAARIRREGFRLPMESSLMEDLDTIFEGGYTRRLEAGVTKSSLRYGPAFMFATKGDETAGEPPVVFSAKSALEATCFQDQRTGVVTSALEMVSESEAIMYLPGLVLEVERRDDGKWFVTEEYPQGHDLVLCEPYVWDWDLDRRFGRSRITRPLIGAIERGVRTLLRQEVTSEFFSAPQRSLMGADESHFTDENGDKIDLWKAITGGIWALPDVWDEDEGKLVRAQIEQLQQASMQPHSDMFESIALQVSSESSLPISYLGVVQNQPAAEGAIKVAEVDMVELIEYQIEQSYKTASVNLARKALAVYHGGVTAGMAADLRKLAARYAKPGTPTESARADAALKYQSAFPDGDPVLTMEMYGLTDDQIKRNVEYQRKMRAASVLNQLANPNGEPVDGQPTEVEVAQAQKERFEALGVAIRAGVDPEDAARRVGLEGIKFTGAVPSMLRVPEAESRKLEE